MLVFREASSNDIQVLKRLEQSVIDAERPFNTSIKSKNAVYYDIQDLIDSPASFLLVVESDQQIIGTGYIQIRQSKLSLEHEKHGYLGFMFVDPEFRGQAINKRIIEQLIDWGKTKGVMDFYLDVYAENKSAIKAYEKVGFSASLVEMRLALSEVN